MQMPSRSCLLIACTLALAACSPGGLAGDQVDSDAGSLPVDQGVPPDASGGDASDSGTQFDSGGGDGGGEQDLGATDDGSLEDSSMPPMDMGVPDDMGTIDAGMDSGLLDAGLVDAGGIEDASWPTADGGPSSTRHIKRPLGSTAAGAGYWEYLPPAYGDGDHFPLIVFYHGIGENGDGSSASLDLVPANGPPMLINTNDWPNSRPFIVLSPQHAGGGCPSANEIHSFIAYAAANYDVDTRRIYLTGLSCGAIGSWDYLGAYADEKQIAALVPIAGDGNGAWGAQGCDLGKVAIWAFHGDADTTVLPSGTTVPMNHLISECSSPPREDAQMTIYPGVGHSSWWQTYNLMAGHDIYAWMLLQTND